MVVILRLICLASFLAFSSAQIYGSRPPQPTPTRKRTPARTWSEYYAQLREYNKRLAQWNEYQKQLKARHAYGAATGTGNQYPSRNTGHQYPTRNNGYYYGKPVVTTPKPTTTTAAGEVEFEYENPTTSTTTTTTTPRYYHRGGYYNNGNYNSNPSYNNRNYNNNNYGSYRQPPNPTHHHGAPNNHHGAPNNHHGATNNHHGHSHSTGHNPPMHNGQYGGHHGGPHSGQYNGHLTNQGGSPFDNNMGGAAGSGPASSGNTVNGLVPTKFNDQFKPPVQETMPRDPMYRQPHNDMAALSNLQQMVGTGKGPSSGKLDWRTRGGSPLQSIRYQTQPQDGSFSTNSILNDLNQLMKTIQGKSSPPSQTEVIGDSSLVSNRLAGFQLGPKDNFRSNRFSEIPQNTVVSGGPVDPQDYLNSLKGLTQPPTTTPTTPLPGREGDYKSGFLGVHLDKPKPTVAQDPGPGHIPIDNFSNGGGTNNNNQGSLNSMQDINAALANLHSILSQSEPNNNQQRFPNNNQQRFPSNNQQAQNYRNQGNNQPASNHGSGFNNPPFGAY